MSFIEEKFFNMITPKLEGVEPVRLRPFTVRFRCHICGDSQKSSHKKRAYVYEKEGHLKFYCHNCGASQNFSFFLKQLSPAVWEQFKIENFGSKGKRTKPVEIDFKPKQVIFETSQLPLGRPLINYPSDDPILQYVNNRKIPRKFLTSLFGIDNLMKITQKIKRYHHLEISASALLIPLYDQDRKFSYLTCRLINAGSLRYINLEFDNENLKLWGLEHIDFDKPIFVFEGPIDAMMVPNSLAMISAKNIELDKYIVNQKPNNPRDICYVFDNEIFSNEQINANVKQKIDNGFSVILYDKHFPAKDVNDAIVNCGLTPLDLFSYLDSRKFNGLTARLEFSRLSKLKNRH